MTRRLVHESTIWNVAAGVGALIIAAVATVTAPEFFPAAAVALLGIVRGISYEARMGGDVYLVINEWGERWWPTVGAVTAGFTLAALGVGDLLWGLLP